jgi:uncharacterized protein
MTSLEQFATVPTPFRAMVTGDTHTRNERPALPEELLRAIRSSDLTIHTGDFCGAPALRVFAAPGPLFAVAGNNDEPELQDRLPLLVRLQAGNRSILLTHGHLERGSGAKRAVIAAYAGIEDIVIFGHSHQPCWEEVDGTWFLNPGSPTMKRREPEYSFAMLEIDDEENARVSFTTFR